MNESRLAMNAPTSTIDTAGHRVRVAGDAVLTERIDWAERINKVAAHSATMPQPSRTGYPRAPLGTVARARAPRGA